MSLPAGMDRLLMPADLPPAAATYSSPAWVVVAAWDAAGAVTTGPLPSAVVPVAGQAGAVRVRRDGPLVSWDIRGASLASGTISIPPGFRPSAGEYPSVPVASGSTAATVLVGATSMFLSATLPAPSSGYGVRLTYVTTGPLPA